jgi:hypothetical protein
MVSTKVVACSVWGRILLDFFPGLLLPSAWDLRLQSPERTLRAKPSLNKCPLPGAAKAGLLLPPLIVVDRNTMQTEATHTDLRVGYMERIVARQSKTATFAAPTRFYLKKKRRIAI